MDVRPLVLLLQKGLPPGARVGHIREFVLPPVVPTPHGDVLVHSSLQKTFFFHEIRV